VAFLDDAAIERERRRAEWETWAREMDKLRASSAAGDVASRATRSASSTPSQQQSPDAIESSSSSRALREVAHVREALEALEERVASSAGVNAGEADSSAIATTLDVDELRQVVREQARELKKVIFVFIYFITYV
jgi:hypothetical protein